MSLSHSLLRPIFLLYSSTSLVCSLFFFFFSSRRRHTRCLSDWSSDVCSSDLSSGAVDHHRVLEVSVDAKNPIARWSVWVDASNGAPIARKQTLMFADGTARSEERRVGKEWRTRGSAHTQITNNRRTPRAEH